MPVAMSGGEDLFGLVGYQLDGKYNVEAAVARGGFGVVYRAKHVALLTSHAVKVLRIPAGLPAEMHQRFLKQFVEEARIIAQFQHPAVVRVTDFGVSNMPTGEQSPWMVLEWIDGATLADSLNARLGHGGRSPHECLELLAPVIDALAAAHDMGIAHRDIKPANIMLAREAPGASMRGSRRANAARPTTRVLDFGIAKIMTEGDDGPASGQTQTGSIMAAYSPRYVSPEQLSGTRTGPWTDVHALGLIITEMLTDQPAYSSTDKLKLTMQVMSPTRPTPAVFGVDVGPWEAVLAKALAITPADRYPNAGELLTALEANVPSASRTRRAVLFLSEPEVSAPVMSRPPRATPAPPASQQLPLEAIFGPHEPHGDVSTLRPATTEQFPIRPGSEQRALIVGALVLCVLVAGATVFLAMRFNAPAAPPHATATQQQTLTETPAALVPTTPVALAQPTPAPPTPALAPLPQAPAVEAPPATPPAFPAPPPVEAGSPTTSRSRSAQPGRRSRNQPPPTLLDFPPEAPRTVLRTFPAPPPVQPPRTAPDNASE
ncbi:MAG: serine/threonine-protein kinase [Polyangiales bacterium]